MALPARQPNEPPSGTYRDMLDKSEEILAPFKENSTPRQIKEKLQELHDQETSQKIIISKTIATLLKNRKARLEKMIGYIDVETSPRSLDRQFISDLCDFFDNHIKTVIHLLPASVYIGIWEDVKESLSNAISALRSALDALDRLNEIIAVEKAGTRTTNKIIKNKSELYNTLLAATEHIEKALSKWDTKLPDQSGTDDEDQTVQEGEVKIENLPKYLDDTSKRLQEQVVSIENIFYPLINLGSKLLQEREIEDFEYVLRTSILKTLLAIPEQTMPDDEESKALINRSKIHHYISYKSDTDSTRGIIINVRLAKIALNLALDRYKLITPLRKMERKDIDKDISDCTKSLEKTIQILKEKP